MGIFETIALSLGVAWASGINLYATVAVLGLLGVTGTVDLPPDLEVLKNPMVIAAAAFMYMIEFIADKVPGVDSTWDAFHTFIRIPAAAVLAAGAFGQIDPELQLVAGLIGGFVGATSHGVKAGTRAVVNTSPEPFSNWGVSLAEDAVVLGGLFTALYHPLAFVIAFALFLLAAVWFLPKLWRGVRALLARVGRLFGRSPPPQPALAATGAEIETSLRSSASRRSD